MKLMNTLGDSVQEAYPRNGDEAWERLVAANERFADEESRGFYLANLACEINAGVRSHLVDSQKPYVTILTCSDSRVSPEIIFGEGLGLLFVIRVAGNIVERATLGSIEYGIHHLGTPLLLILGHEKCGAVIAASGRKDFSGGVGKLLLELQPSISHSCEIVKDRWWELKGGDCGNYDKALEEAVQVNAVMQELELLETSPIVRELFYSGKLRIQSAYYELKSGRVRAVSNDIRLRVFKGKEMYLKE